MSNRANIIVISAPSGSGKTSLTNRVLKEVSGLEFSVSHTTRKPRRGERDGAEYSFVSEKEFQEMVRRDSFLEYAHVHGNLYGTSRAFVDAQLAAGNDVILEIDVQGAMKIKEKNPQAVLIFVLPPSLEVLEARLKGRGSDDESVIDRRLQIAKEELKYYRNYQYVIINREIEESLGKLKSIIIAARCGLRRQTEQAEEIIKTFKGS
ncbi:guanylate kinase [Acidobacteria bacterium AH-259-L09]|nr:guanylate kinase [Acidobacteria bacterium AH-259-L09]